MIIRQISKTGLLISCGDVLSGLCSIMTEFVEMKADASLKKQASNHLFV